VLKAAAKLGYQPNVIARSLITRESRLIGLIMGEWENPFYTVMLRELTERLQARNYRLMLLTCGAGSDVDASIRLLRQYQVEGILMVSAQPGAEVAEECSNAGVRIVLVNRDGGNLPASGIVLDNERVGREIAESLLDAGYQKFALARGDASLTSSGSRYAGFRSVLESARRGTVVLDSSDIMGYAKGRAFAVEALRGTIRPDAIVCSADITAIGVLDGARIDLGIDVPQTLGVVGFGDIPAAGWAANNLTTVRIPLDMLIDASVNELFNTREGRRRRSLVFTAQIVPRGTTRPPRRQQTARRS
jgi:DNA-binding LacI/PurR family transcriptional regulator